MKIFEKVCASLLVTTVAFSFFGCSKKDKKAEQDEEKFELTIDGFNDALDELDYEKYDDKDVFLDDLIKGATMRRAVYRYEKDDADYLYDEVVNRFHLCPDVDVDEITISLKYDRFEGTNVATRAYFIVFEDEDDAEQFVEMAVEGFNTDAAIKEADGYSYATKDDVNGHYNSLAGVYRQGKNVLFTSGEYDIDDENRFVVNICDEMELKAP